MEIVRKRERVVVVEYERVFSWRDDPSAGYAFPCDESGELDRSKMNPCATANHMACTNGRFDVVDEGVRRREHSYVESAVGRCDCGREVVLDGFTNTCACGADWNSCGQRLGPREQWGEETGESLADILRIP